MGIWENNFTPYLAYQQTLLKSRERERERERNESVYWREESRVWGISFWRIISQIHPIFFNQAFVRIKGRSATYTLETSNTILHVLSTK